jgi:hypothetical protein
MVEINKDLADPCKNCKYLGVSIFTSIDPLPCESCKEPDFLGWER